MSDLTHTHGETEEERAAAKERAEAAEESAEAAEKRVEAGELPTTIEEALADKIASGEVSEDAIITGAGDIYDPSPEAAEKVANPQSEPNPEGLPMEAQPDGSLVPKDDTSADASTTVYPDGTELGGRGSLPSDPPKSEDKDEDKEGGGEG